MSTKDGRIGWGIRHVFHRAIQRHDAQAEEQRSAGRLSRHRLTDVMEQPGQRTRPHLRATVGECAVGGQGDQRIRPQQAQPTRQFGQHGSHRQRRRDVQRNHQPDHHGQAQFAFTRVASCGLLDGAPNGLLGDSPTQRLNGQSPAELAHHVFISRILNPMG